MINIANPTTEITIMAWALESYVLHMFPLQYLLAHSLSLSQLSPSILMLFKHVLAEEQNLSEQQPVEQSLLESQSTTHSLKCEHTCVCLLQQRDIHSNP